MVLLKKNVKIKLKWNKQYYLTIKNKKHITKLLQNQKSENIK